MTADPSSISSLENAPLGNTFIEYLKSRDEMFERQKQKQLQEFLTLHNINTHSEEAYLYTFAFVAGGWTQQTPEALRNDYYVKTLQEASQTDFSDFDAYDTRHSHRKQAAYYTPDALNDLDNLKVKGEHVDSFTEFFQQLHRIERDSNDDVEAFDVAMNSIKNQSQFRRLSAFDFLEFIVRSLSHKWLLPDHLKLDYLKDNKPEEGFELLFDINFGDPRAEELLRLVEDYGREKLGMPEVDVIFDIESCLCELKKAEEDDILEENLHPEDHASNC